MESYARAECDCCPESLVVETSRQHKQEAAKSGCSRERDRIEDSVVEKTGTLSIRRPGTIDGPPVGHHLILIDRLRTYLTHMRSIQVAYSKAEDPVPMISDVAE